MSKLLTAVSTVDISGAFVEFQPKISLDKSGFPLLCAFEMLARGKVVVEGQSFSLPANIGDLMDALVRAGGVDNWSSWLLSKADEAISKLKIDVAINVDPLELAHASNFPSMLKQNIRECHRKHVIVEITERAPLDSKEVVCLNSLVLDPDIACHLSIDDFCQIPPLSTENAPSLAKFRDGGYSHIYYLAELSATEIKVDKSLADHIAGNRTRSCYLAAWIVSLPSYFEGMKVVFEGIENSFPDDFLRKFYGNPQVLFQGYKYGRPMSLDSAVGLKFN